MVEHVAFLEEFAVAAAHPHYLLEDQAREDLLGSQAQTEKDFVGVLFYEDSQEVQGYPDCDEEVGIVLVLFRGFLIIDECEDDPNDDGTGKPHASSYYRQYGADGDLKP